MTLLKKYKEIIFFIFAISFFIFSVTFSVSAQTSGVVKGGQSLDQSATNSVVCKPLISHYLRFGQENNPTQVRLLQAFLSGVENYNVDINGNFDQKTLVAVHAFQQKYATDILEPWGLATENSTGYVYYTTQNKINEIFCGRYIPLSGIQKADIARAGGDIAKLGDNKVGLISGIISENVSQNSATTVKLTLTDTTKSDELVGDHQAKAQDKIKEIATAAFVFPETPREAAFFGLWFILILALVYILGSLIAGMRDPIGLSQKQIRMRKILYFMVGTLIGLVVAVAMKLAAIIIPLIIVIIALSFGLLYYARKNS